MFSFILFTTIVHHHHCTAIICKYYENAPDYTHVAASNHDSDWMDNKNGQFLIWNILSTASIDSGNTVST